MFEALLRSNEPVIHERLTILRRYFLNMLNLIVLVSTRTVSTSPSLALSLLLSPVFSPAEPDFTTGVKLRSNLVNQVLHICAPSLKFFRALPYP